MPTASNNGDVKVRTYNIGFGDCFLFQLPDPQGCRPRLMLVDFGQHLSGKANTLTKIAKDIVAQANAITGDAVIDVVVATHRHFDHISGFDLKICDDITVGEVWLPWTEDPNNPEAMALKQMQFEFARALSSRVSARSDAHDFLQNSLMPLSNLGAMTTLLEGFKGSPERRFLPKREKESGTDTLVTKPSFATTHLPGVKIHALGPSYDPKIVATLKPPKGEYYEFLSAAAATSSAEHRATLFDSKYRLSRLQHKRTAKHLHSRDELDELKKRAHFDPELAAKKLEDMINGTSLVLFLEVGDIRILLGGDAEWGTWSEILGDSKWTALLSQTSLYKVSHHGSYNGTPRRFVEDHLPEDAVSLVSLMPMEKWPSIPRASLMTALDKGKRKVIRTDKPPTKGGVVTDVDRDGLWIDVSISSPD